MKRLYSPERAPSFGRDQGVCIGTGSSQGGAKPWVSSNEGGWRVPLIGHIAAVDRTDDKVTNIQAKHVVRPLIAIHIHDDLRKMPNRNISKEMVGQLSRGMIFCNRQTEFRTEVMKMPTFHILLHRSLRSTQSSPPSHQRTRRAASPARWTLPRRSPRLWGSEATPWSSPWSCEATPWSSPCSCGASPWWSSCCCGTGSWKTSGRLHHQRGPEIMVLVKRTIHTQNYIQPVQLHLKSLENVIVNFFILNY